MAENTNEAKAAQAPEASAPAQPAAEGQEAPKKSGSNMLGIAKSRIKPTVNPEVSYASIGLNDEHGKFGNIFFKTDKLRESKKNPDVAYLPLGKDIQYNVSFYDENNKNTVVKMTGSEIVSKNREFMHANNKQRTASLESQVTAQQPQTEAQAEA